MPRRLSIHYIPGGDEGSLDGAAGVVVFAFVDDEDITGLNGMLDAVDGQDSAALDEDEDFIDIVDMAGFGMGGFAGLEYVDAAVGDFGITEMLGHEVQAVGFQVGDL